MELYIALGWVDMEAIRVMELLGITPNVDPFSSSDGAEFDLVEFVTTQNGIEYISDELQQFNRKWGTGLEWRSIDDIYILIWFELENTLLGSLDCIEMIYHTEVDPEIIEFQWNEHNKITKKLEINCPKPRLQTIENLSNWYYGQT